MSEKENAFTRDELIELLDDPETPRISTGTVRELIRSLLAEMDKSKVWDGAPDNAGFASVNFCKESGVPLQFGKTMFYTRTLPKSRARVIAEEFFDSEAYIGFCEIAILKALAEKEAGK